LTSGAATADGLLLGWTAEAAVATGEGETLGADSAVATGAVAIDGLVGTQAAITRVRLASTMAALGEQAIGSAWTITNAASAEGGMP